MDESIVIIVDTGDEVRDKFEMFERLLGDNIIKSIRHEEHVTIRTNKFNIRIYKKNTQSFHAVKADHLFNLVQDKEFHNMVALPMTNIRRF